MPARQPPFGRRRLVCRGVTIKIGNMENVNLTDHFLIAMPSLTDPYFAGALVYVCEHTENGAMGLIVNRPIDMTLSVLYEKIDLPLEIPELANLPVYFGGPVMIDRGFVLHRPAGNWQATLKVPGCDLGMTSSRDILIELGSKGEPRDTLVSLGYAGWGAGQIEDEMGQNAWLSAPASHDILFGMPPEERLPAVMQRLGFSLSQLSETAGHA